MRFRRGKNARGFTLLEVMLAFVVFALSFATVLEIMAASMRSIRRANDDTAVALFAQSIMDQVGTDIPLEESSLNGTGMQRYQWRLDIYPLASKAEANDAYSVELADMSGVQLYKVELNVDWVAGQQQRDLQFSTIRSIVLQQRKNGR